MDLRPYSELEIDTHLEVLRSDASLHEQVGNYQRAAKIEKTVAIIEQLRNVPVSTDVYRLYDKNKKLILEADNVFDFLTKIGEIVKIDYHRGNLKQRLRDMKYYLKYPPAIGDDFIITKNTVMTEDTDVNRISGSNRAVGTWYVVDITNQTITKYDRVVDAAAVTGCSPSTIQSSIRRGGLCGKSRYAVRRTQEDAQQVMDKYKSPPPTPVRRTIQRIDLFHEGRTTVIKSMPDFRGLLGLVGCTEKTLVTELRNSNDGELRSLPKTPGYQVRVYFNNCKRKKDNSS